MGSPERTEALDTSLTWRRRTQPPRCPRRSRWPRRSPAGRGRRCRPKACLHCSDSAPPLLGLPGQALSSAGRSDKENGYRAHYLWFMAFPDHHWQPLCFGVDAIVQGRWGWGVWGDWEEHIPHIHSVTRDTYTLHVVSRASLRPFSCISASIPHFH